MPESKGNFWKSPLTRSRIKSDDVKLPEMLLGYFIGPFGALLSSGIFTSILQNYFTDVLKLDLGFLTTLQLISTVLIVAANLIVGQLIERTKALAGKARPWILLSALTLSVSSVLMFIVPFEGTAKMVWIAIAYNLYYAVAYPIYNTANSTMIPVSTRDSKQRGALASFTNVAGLADMGVGSMMFPMLVSFALKEDQYLWFIAMLAVGVFSALTIYLQFMFTRERVTEEGRTEEVEPPQKTVSLSEQLKAVTSDRMWWIVMAFYMLFQWSGAMKNGSMSYFCKWVLDNTFFGTADAWGASQGLLSIMGAIPMAIAAVFVVPLANKFGKRLVCGVFMLVGAVGGVIAGLGGGNIVPVAIGVALKCLGSSPACYLILAMIADVIDHIEYRTGIRTDGLTMSITDCEERNATPYIGYDSCNHRDTATGEPGDIHLNQAGAAQQVIDNAVGLPQHQVPDNTDHQASHRPRHQGQSTGNAADLEFAGQQPCKPEAEHRLESHTQQNIDCGVPQRFQEELILCKNRYKVLQADEVPGIGFGDFIGFRTHHKDVYDGPNHKTYDKCQHGGQQQIRRCQPPVVHHRPFFAELQLCSVLFAHGFLLVSIRRFQQNLHQGAAVIAKCLESLPCLLQAIFSADKRLHIHLAAGQNINHLLKVGIIGVAAAENIQLLLQKDGMEERCIALAVANQNNLCCEGCLIYAGQERFRCAAALNADIKAIAVRNLLVQGFQLLWVLAIGNAVSAHLLCLFQSAVQQIRHIDLCTNSLCAQHSKHSDGARADNKNLVSLLHIAAADAVMADAERLHQCQLPCAQPLAGEDSLHGHCDVFLERTIALDTHCLVMRRSGRPVQPGSAPCWRIRRTWRAQ